MIAETDVLKAGGGRRDRRGFTSAAVVEVGAGGGGGIEALDFNSGGASARTISDDFATTRAATARKRAGWRSCIEDDARAALIMEGNSKLHLVVKKIS